MNSVAYNENIAIKKSINEMIDSMPNDKLIEVYDYIRFLASNTSKLSFEDMDCYALSKPALAKD